jgi:hypothetical protein
MIFACETLEQRDDDGNLEAVGVRWTEARVFAESVLDTVGQVLAIGVFMAAVVAFTGAAIGKVPLELSLGLLGVSVVIFFGFIITSARLEGVPRELSFWRDGTCYAPDGLRCLAWRQDRLPWPVSDIENIEVEQTVKPVPGKDTVYDHGVRIMVRRGRIAHVAHRLEADDAHKLCMLLIEALAELRAGAGSERVASRRAGSAARQEQLID